MKAHSKSRDGIRQRSNGTWEARVCVGYTESGNPKTISVYGRTREECADKRNEARYKHGLGLPVQPKADTLCTFFWTWLEDIKRPSIRPDTYRSYEQLLRVHVVGTREEPVGLGKIKVQRLTALQVQSFLNRKREDGLSPRTVQYLLALLHGGLEQAKRYGFVSQNVAELAEAPKSKATERRFLDQKEARALLKACKGHRWHALFAVGLAMGFRISECLGLRWIDIDQKADTITVRNQYQRLPKSQGGPRLAEPKTERAKATIKMPKFLAALLAEHRIKQNAERKTMGEKWQETGFVFTTSTGTPCDERRVRTELDKLVTKAEIAPVTFHGLRHSAGSLLLAQGLDIFAAKELLRHSQISLTANLYAHATSKLRSDTADALDRAFGA
jgi:integrase